VIPPGAVSTHTLACPCCANIFCADVNREKLMKNHKVLEVDLVNVREYNQELGDNLESRPAEYLPLVRYTVSAQ
jgi:hypothetical protein